MNRREMFLARADVQETIAQAHKKVAMARGNVSVLAQPEPKRRNIIKAASLLAFAAISGVALLAGTSSADATIVFENVLFKSSIGNTNRTEAARWSDIKNVRDFGAVGDGSTDDTAAIQAAVNYQTTPYTVKDRGEVFFPPGTYHTTAPVTYNLSDYFGIHFRGVGSRSIIDAAFAGFVFDRSLSPSDNPTGGIRSFEKLVIYNSHASSGGIRMGSTVIGSVKKCVISAQQGIIMEDADGGANQSCIVENCGVSCNPSDYTGSIGIATSANAVISACDMNGVEKAIMCAATSGVVIMACRLEVCGTGVVLGASPSGSLTSLGGVNIIGGTFESCSTAVDCVGGIGNFFISGLQIQGFLASAPGATNPQYGIRLRNEASFGVLNGVQVGGYFDVAAISISGTTSRGGIAVIGCRAGNSNGGAVAWATPAEAHTAEFINCDINPTYLYAGLPTSTNLRTGDTYYITDANTATLGNNVTAGGAPNTHGWVTYNGTNWTLMSK